jgi:hypothetical protein
MSAKKKNATPCVICNATGAQPGDYCEKHQEELHRLDHQYETLFRLQRSSRGKDHEVYNVYLRGDCDPCGRIMVAETDPESLMLTVLISGNLDLNSSISDYEALKAPCTYADKLRERIENDIIRSWHGNPSACVDVFSILDRQPEHWDVVAQERSAEEDEEALEPHPPSGKKHSIH